MRKNIMTVVLATISILPFTGCNNDYLGDAVEQTSIERIEQMPKIPQPYKIIDFRQKAIDYDAYVFDEKTRVMGSPLIWYDNARRNIDQETFGLYTAVNDSRQGPDKHGGEFHESLNSLTTLIGSTLVGIDKSHQNGRNYVKMVQNYFNTENGWNIMMNNTSPEVAKFGGGYGRDWWYDVFPNLLYYALCDLYPGVEGADDILYSIAEQFVKADSVLNGNYDYSYFDYAQMKGMTNNIPMQQDAAGGHAWVLYAAYRKFGDIRYLEHAKSALESLLGQNESRFYEVLLPMSAIVAARMNAEQGTDYDVKKIIDWTFEGCHSPSGRNGWGVICERWGDYDCHGLQGSLLDGGGYAFFMNSVKLAMPLVPMVKYEPQFARSIGRWMLNLANNCRLFYPTEIDEAHQALPEMRNLTNGLVVYEGLRKQDVDGYERLKGVSPVATGDGPKWAQNSSESMFTLYSTGAVGILGAMVNTTDVEGILRINCNTTDFYAGRPFPVYLYYNPLDMETEVSVEAEGDKCDLFDCIAHTYVAQGVSGCTKVKMPADMSRVIAVLPAGTRLHTEGNRVVTSDGRIVAYK